MWGRGHHPQHRHRTQNHSSLVTFNVGAKDTAPPAMSKDGASPGKRAYQVLGFVCCSTARACPL